ncbi:MAG TPA: D-allulose 6-phosphate 3-epimerase [Candidatus Atribacteria bacterium]|nr:D-allulose 6-phosphate 3-epimerase [Candidatus Atribacteria bacterium]
MKAQFSVSVMCMDLLDIRSQIETLNGCADYYHFDIMDGHFSPNLMLPPLFVKHLAPAMKLPIEAHLMVDDPGQYIDELAAAGATYISLHAETINTHAFRLISRIKSLGCKVGIALNPATPLEYIKHYLNHVDLLTIMTVDIGYSGSPFVVEMLDKIREAVRLRGENDYHYKIQVDGACNEKTFKMLTEAGAEIFVMGNTGLFKNDPDVGRAYSIMMDNFNREVR